VLVSAPGTLVPASEVRRLYAPIDGELANIYIAEGQPVLKGDVVARLYARGAIEAARNALEARLKLEDAEREWKEFPQKKALLDQRVAALKEAMDTEERQHQRRLAEGTSQMARRPARAVAGSAHQPRGCAPRRRRRRDEAAKYERLFALPGGGGVSQLQVEGKKNALQAAENAVRVAESRVGELAPARAWKPPRPGASWRPAASSWSLRLQYEAATREATNVEEKLRLQVQTARLVADAAARIQFENIDKDNFLRILAPVDGVITEVTSTQPGDKIQANTPLGGIAPKNTRPILKIEIAEQDRAFLREGLPVQLKFNAFPYQRYGIIGGTLQFISPATKASRRPSSRCTKAASRSTATTTRSATPIAYPLRYGMTAAAEIVVRKRRLIDMALDPFRQIGG
jgi:hemolysin D